MPRVLKRLESVVPRRASGYGGKARSLAALARAGFPVRWYRAAAGQGNARARLNLGLIYKAARDYPESVRWFRVAAKQGYPKAQFNLALMYAGGLGVSRDPLEALKWYRTAAEEGFVAAQMRLGEMYLAGDGAPRDPAEAANWLTLAEEQGASAAQSSLGKMYKDGVAGVDGLDGVVSLALSPDGANL